MRSRRLHAHSRSREAGALCRLPARGGCGGRGLRAARARLGPRRARLRGLGGRGRRAQLQLEAGHGCAGGASHVQAGASVMHRWASEWWLCLHKPFALLFGNMVLGWAWAAG